MNKRSMIPSFSSAFKIITIIKLNILPKRPKHHHTTTNTMKLTPTSLLLTISTLPTTQSIRDPLQHRQGVFSPWYSNLQL
jgi:hypothetical protein